MTSDNVFNKESFLKLPSEQIKRIVLKHRKPKTGIFIADGTRRLVMTRTRLSPNSDAFYNEYTRIFVESLKESLSIFFNHGLETLFFPLFGPSLLLRNNKFQSITIPNAYKKIFLSDEWLNFYQNSGIRVKAYGDLSQLAKIDGHRLNMAEGIKKAIQATASNNRHTLYFGFMSESTPALEMSEQVIDFYKSHQRPPDQHEMREIYYGEYLGDADFVIFSDKLSMRALPPLVPTGKSKIYYLPVPGYLGLSTLNFRRIIYDLLFLHPDDSLPGYSDDELQYIESLEKYYASHRDTIIGTVSKTGKLLVPDFKHPDSDKRR